VTGVRRLMAVGGLTVLCAACSTGVVPHASHDSPTDKGTPGLRDAARGWSKAFLTGTVADIRGSEGASCLSTPTVTPSVAEAYLRSQRAAMEHELGVPLASIRTDGVQVRDVTATSGDAEVHYALPASIVGNDN
jgi:hypothetical protein